MNEVSTNEREIVLDTVVTGDCRNVERPRPEAAAIPTSTTSEALFDVSTAFSLPHTQSHVVTDISCTHFVTDVVIVSETNTNKDPPKKVEIDDKTTKRLKKTNKKTKTKKKKKKKKKKLKVKKGQEKETTKALAEVRTLSSFPIPSRTLLCSLYLASSYTQQATKLKRTTKEEKKKQTEKEKGASVSSHHPNATLTDDSIRRRKPSTPTKAFLDCVCMHFVLFRVACE
jgi:hypothetical protein